MTLDRFRYDHDSALVQSLPFRRSLYTENAACFNLTLDLTQEKSLTQDTFVI